jgi:tetratricopeptide (TPR) repeat protein
LGNIYSKQQKDEAAIEYYRKALAMDYGRVHWRLAFARLLAKKERIPEAMQQARICLRLRPQLKAAERLLADLSLHPASLDGEDKLP